jgi:hypothetical protein
LAGIFLNKFYLWLGAFGGNLFFVVGEKRFWGGKILGGQYFFKGQGDLDPGAGMMSKDL